MLTDMQFHSPAQSCVTCTDVQYKCVSDTAPVWEIQLTGGKMVVTEPPKDPKKKRDRKPR